MTPSWRPPRAAPGVSDAGTRHKRDIRANSSIKTTVTLQVDDLLGLRDREGNSVFPALMGIGPNEAVLFHAFRGVLLDDPGGLVEAVVPVRGRPDAVALVFNRRRGRSVGLASPAAGEAAPCRFEFREHGSRLGLAVSTDPMPVPCRWSAIIARLPRRVDRWRVAAGAARADGAAPSIPELLAHDALVEAVPRVEQHLHGDAVIHLDVDR